MMIEPLVSVVVPVYNVEKYLSQCIDSIISQQYKNIELVLVDDGSVDKSGEICDDYAIIDKRISVYHKINGGLSDARNYGINKAKGKYVMFLDSDDYFVNDMAIKTLVEYAEKNKVQVVIAPFIYDFDGELSSPKFVAKQDLHAMDILEAYKYMISNGCFLVSACSKLLLLDFIKGNNLYFTKGIIAEDNEWFFRLMRVVQTLGNIQDAFYVYRQNRQESITSKVQPKQITDMLYIIEQSRKYYETAIDKEICKCEMSFCAYLWCICLAKCRQLDDKSLLKSTKTLVNILDFDMYPKVKYVRICYKLLGANITGELLKRYMLGRDRRNIK